jgi:hypothetical protein
MISGFIIESYIHDKKNILNATLNKPANKNSNLPYKLILFTKTIANTPDTQDLVLTKETQFYYDKGTLKYILNGSNSDVKYTLLKYSNNKPIVLEGKYFLYDDSNQEILRMSSNDGTLLGGLNTLFTKPRKHQTKRKYKIRKTLRKRKHKKT